MKKLLAIISIICFLVVGVSATSFAALTLAWDPVVEDATHGAAVGYIVFFTDQSTSTVYNYNAGLNTSVLCSTLHWNPGSHYVNVYVVAYNAAGMSGPSNVLEYVMDGFTPPPDSLPQPVMVPGVPGGLAVQDI